MRNSILTIILMSVGFGVTGSAFAADKKAPADKKMQATPEQRKKMAEAHEKMAACLRSDKAFEECHKEMASSCKDMMGPHGCEMMGHHGMHAGEHGEHEHHE